MLTKDRSNLLMSPASTTSNVNPVPSIFDVVICGGGLAGLTLARQIRRQLPDLRVAVVDRAKRPIPEATWKVGESSVEIGSQYFESLGLTEYLLERQLVKFGLRFFPGGGHAEINTRSEVGPSQEPPVRSYQLDRGRFENDLREMNERDGVVLFEGMKVDGVELGKDGLAHRVRLVQLAQTQLTQTGEQKLQGDVNLEARWVVDATGREALLRKRLQLTEKSGHAAHSGWFRVEGRVDINEWVPPTPANAHWFGHEWAEKRWRSTNHLMGPGYWCWIIPLASGNTSIGVVVHNELHGFEQVKSLDACLEFIRIHEPQLSKEVARRQILDFKCLSGYSHTASSMWSAERYAMVGEAGAFVDPLYSPGSDFIAFANCFTVELMKADYQGLELEQRVAATNVRYRALVSNAIELFRQAAPVYGHAKAMAAKVYFDNFAYWSFMAQYYVQGVYRHHDDEHDGYVRLGIELAQVSNRVQTLLRVWAELAPCTSTQAFVGMPRYPSLLVDAYMDLQKRLTVAQATTLLSQRLQQAKEIAQELAFRILVAEGPETGQRILRQAESSTDGEMLSGAERWQISMARVRLESLPGLERRKQLSLAVRDVERTLGKVVRHSNWEQAVHVAATPPNVSDCRTADA